MNEEQQQNNVASSDSTGLNNQVPGSDSSTLTEPIITTKRSSGKKRIILVAILAALIVVGAAMATLWYLSNEKSESSSTKTTQTESSLQETSLILSVPEDNDVVKNALLPYYSARLKGDVESAKKFYTTRYDPSFDGLDFDWSLDVSGGKVDVRMLTIGEFSPIANDSTTEIRYSKALVSVSINDIDFEEMVTIETKKTESNEYEYVINQDSVENDVSRIVTSKDGTKYQVVDEAANRPDDAPFVLIGIDEPTGGCGKYNPATNYCTFLKNATNTDIDWEIIKLEEFITSANGIYLGSSELQYVAGSTDEVMFEGSIGDAGYSGISRYGLNIMSGEITATSAIESLYYFSDASSEISNDIPVVVTSACSIYAGESISSYSITHNNKKYELWECMEEADTSSDPAARSNGAVYLVENSKIVETVSFTFNPSDDAYGIDFAEDFSLSDVKMKLTIFANSYTLSGSGLEETPAN